MNLPLSLAAIDEIIDAVDAQSSPKYIWMPPEDMESLRQKVREHDRAEKLGYEDARAYRRELSRLGAIHGRRLDARLEYWFRLRQ